jgi:hypothetical protein
MGSLTNVVSTLERIIEWDFAGKFPENRPIDDIQEYLSRCDVPRDAKEWHEDKMAWVREDSDSPKFEALRESVGTSLLRAINKAALLRMWTAGKVNIPDSLITPKGLLYAALADILMAFKCFAVVATDFDMRFGNFMATVMMYLKKTYGLTVIMASLAWPGGWFKEWGYLHRHTELEGFKFDTKDWYLRSQIADPTLRGILAPRNTVPCLYLPAHPKPPERADGPNSGPILQNICFYEEMDEDADTI